MSKIENRLNFCHVEIECIACGRIFVAGDPTAIWMDDDGSELGNVCDDCLILGAEGIGKMLIARGEAMKAEARMLNEMAEALMALGQEPLVLKLDSSRIKTEVDY